MMYSLSSDHSIPNELWKVGGKEPYAPGSVFLGGCVYIDPSAFTKILLYYQNYRSWKSRIEKSMWSSSVAVDTWYKELVLTFKISFHEDS